MLWNPAVQRVNYRVLRSHAIPRATYSVTRSPAVTRVTFRFPPTHLLNNDIDKYNIYVFYNFYVLPLIVHNWCFVRFLCKIANIKTFISHPNLAPRLKKEYSYTSTSSGSPWPVLG